MPKHPMRRVAGVLTAVSFAFFAASVPYVLSAPEPAAAVTTPVSLRSGLWSDASLWSTGRVPGANDQATVSTGNAVTYDLPASTVAGVTVAEAGRLTFAPDRSTTLASTGNVVVNGTLSLRPANSAVRQTLRFTGINEANFVGGGLTMMGDSPIASDVGLWVMGNGVLDAVGTAKAAWVHLAGGSTVGAGSITTLEAPSGWQAGDDVTITPTDAISAGSASYKNFDDTRIATLGGNTVRVTPVLAHTHPSVRGTWSAEALNLTRNVIIEGTPSGRTHIMIMSMRPQTIENVQVRYVGPRKATSAVTGRYGIHFHHGMDGSRGSIVSGTVVRDDGNHAFVAHDSNGILFQNDVAYNINEDAYWWDDNPDTRTPGPESNDIVYDHNVAAKVWDPNKRGYRLTGFNLLQGLRNVAKNNVAVGVQGTKGASGFLWPESFGAHKAGLWTFNQGNVAHNNQSDGVFVWQNDSQAHTISNFTGYNNGYAGVELGAYSNRYRILGNVLYGNAIGVVFHALSDSVPAALTDSLVDEGGLGKYSVAFVAHTEPTSVPIYIARNQFKGYTVAAVAWIGGSGSGDAADVEDFIDNSFSGNAFTALAGTAPLKVRVQQSGVAFTLTQPAACVGSYVAAWNLCQASIAPFGSPLR